MRPWPTFAATAAVSALLLASAMAAGPSPASAAADAVVDCHAWAYYPNVLISSARNMSCRAAKRDMRRYNGSIRRYFRTPGGFSCSQVSGGRLGGQWRCIRGSKAYRFDFGD